jgi:hypothetical protein
VVAAAGAQAAFLLNALSYIGLIVVLLTWKRPAAPNPLPPETVGAAVRAGLRYVRLSPTMTGPSRLNPRSIGLWTSRA